MLKDNQLMQELDRLVDEMDKIVVKIQSINEDIKKRQHDYCPIGLSHCSSCGAQFAYPVSSCSSCNTSFVE